MRVPNEIENPWRLGLHFGGASACPGEAFCEDGSSRAVVTLFWRTKAGSRIRSPPDYPNTIKSSRDIRAIRG
jgi:hypothetical protein